MGRRSTSVGRVRGLSSPSKMRSPLKPKKSPMKTKKSPLKSRMSSSKSMSKKKSSKSSSKALFEETSRSKVTLNKCQVLRDAANSLQLSSSCPTSHFRCRESEFLDILAFAQTSLATKMSGCLFVSGQPGTGKSATIKHVLNSLSNDMAFSEDCDIIELNGMQVIEGRQLYTLIWRTLTKQKLSAARALESLEHYFSSRHQQQKKRREKRSKSASRAGTKDSEATRRATLMVLDELDVLVGKRNESVLYNIFEWASRGAESRLIVIAIANSMDLPERYLSKRIASRIGLSRLEFNAYTHEQLYTIVFDRLDRVSNDSSSIFNRDAVRLVSKKVASLSGDARRCLDICRRAVEIAEVEHSTSDNTKEIKDSRASKNNVDRIRRESRKKKFKRIRSFDSDEESDEEGNKENDKVGNLDCTSISNPLVGLQHVEQSLKEMFDKPKQVCMRQCSVYEKLVLKAILTDFRLSGIEETTVTRLRTHLVEELHLKNMKLISSDTLIKLCLALANVGLIVMQGKQLGIHVRIRLNVSQDEALFALDS